MKNIKQLNIRSTSDNYLKYLKEYNNINSLKLEYTHVNDLDELHKSQYLLSFNQFLTSLTNLKQLESLHLKGSCLNDEDIISLLSEQLKLLPNLSSFRFNTIDSYKNNIIHSKDLRLLVDTVLTMINLKSISLLIISEKGIGILNFLDNIEKLNQLEELEFICIYIYIIYIK